MEFKLCFILLLVVGAVALDKDASSQLWKQITVANVLERDPDLKEFMRPPQMARLINEIPQSLKNTHQMVVHTVIDGKVLYECLGEKSFYEMLRNDAVLIADFVETYASEMGVKDLYFVTYFLDQLHYDYLRSNIGPLFTNEALFEKIYEHYFELFMQLPAIRMSIDLGDSLLEHNKFLIPDAYMLQGFRFRDRMFPIRDSGLWEDNLKKSREASL